MNKRILIVEDEKNIVDILSFNLSKEGYETLEAESVVENYLDSAVMAKLGTVTIIHGKGTGALRKAVHEILKRNKAVKSFRLGRYGEGEDGVTVADPTCVEQRSVTLGVNDDNYIVVTSGLSEGEKVVYMEQAAGEAAGG